MAQRGKRINRNDNDLASCPGAIKRRKCRTGPTAIGSSSVAQAMGPSEEEETMASSSQGGASWTPRTVSDIKISSIYNRSAAEAPAELFRKDLISAMKLPDSEPLSPNEYWVITDQWKQEWERGVQVPVNPDSLPEPMVTVMQTSSTKLHGEFKLPKKFIRISRDDYFNPEDHHLSTTPARAEKACAYDLDDIDIAWLDVLNGERAQAGQPPVTESQLERVIEELEVRCWERIQTIVKNEEGLGIEFDENVICDVCRSPDSEEGNEMVFCDCCNICVHQACYGITSIPDGSWLCRTCSLSQRPDCVLCPNKGGAMKCTRSGQKWAHVSCALWIPEVSIGCVERMEPITKISSIPQSRWALICVLCRERVGACIQCSIKTCKTAYHVTCAFKFGLEMKAIIEDEMADDGVKLRSYCQKHSRTNTKDKVEASGSTGSGCGKGGSDSEDGDSRRRKRKDMTSEEKNQARAAKLQEIEAEFDKHVSLKDITSQQLDIDPEGIVYIYNYWKLKRRAGHNKPLLAPRCGELSSAGARAQGQAADLEKMRTFVQLRQDLERVRNLCYMVGRREKLCRTFLRLREQTFHKQALVLSGPLLPPAATAAVLEANHGPSIYDRLYSHLDSEDHTRDFDTILARIAGEKSPSPDPCDEKKIQPDFNGASNKKLYFNGSVRRKSFYGSDLSSISSSETDVKPDIKSPNKSSNKCTKSKNSIKVESESSTEEETSTPKTRTVRRRIKKSSTPDRPRMSLRDSSESDKPESANNRSKTLKHMEKELDSASGSESDELLPLSTGTTARLGPSVASAIYSDTDSDSQEHTSHSVLITKAAVKEFSAADISKNSQKSFNKERQENQDDSIKNKENVKTSKKKDYIPSALIVPQRQAAKKASENMQRSQAKKENITTEPTEPIKSPIEESKPVKPKEKVSGKKQKDVKAIKEIKNNDVYDFDKEFGDGNEILAYVPQRQAAKKAAEHIKSGLGSKVAPTETETIDIKKKELPEIGKKKDVKKEDSPKKEEQIKKEETKKSIKKVPEPKNLSSSNSESSSSSSCSSSSDSSSDSDDGKSPAQETSKDPVSSSSSSSESDSGQQTKNKTMNKRVTNKITEDNEIEKKTGRKLKKLPEKKLKTSDGRHGPEFQPPSIERDESCRTTKEHQQQQQQQPSKQQSIAKKADQKDIKKPWPVQQSSSNQSTLGGSRDNDGARSHSGSKPVKKPIKQSQQSAVKKDDSRAKSENRKRKSNEVQPKDEKNVEKTVTVKKMEKSLTEKTIKEVEKEKEVIKEKDNAKIISPNRSPIESIKADDKKLKKPVNKNIINTLEEEMKQRRTERNSPKKSLRGLDKLLEKREHLDKLSRNKVMEVKNETEKSICNDSKKKDLLGEKNEESKNVIKHEDHKNHFINENLSIDQKVEEQSTVKKDIEEVPEKSVDKKIIEEPVELVSVDTEIRILEHEPPKENMDNNLPKITSEKVILNETTDKECHKRRKSINRSIFSPQHGSKDPSVSELFDFDQDILTDDMVNDDGFSIPRDAEERTAPLTFSFHNELWFKEDSKEDSARETLHLVEKLRQELSKKSNSSQFELESVPTEEVKKEETPIDKPFEQKSRHQEKSTKVPDAENVTPIENKSNSNFTQVSDDLSCKNHMVDEKRKDCYPNNTEQHYAPTYNEDLEISKVSIVERAKLDRAQADERWVPPSIENFNPDVHLNTIMDNQNHRYVAHQFSNDMSVIPESNSEALTHPQINLNIQEQYLMQQAHSIARAAQHIETHPDVRLQQLPMMDQPIPSQIVDEITPMEIVNRHLIGLPNSEDDQGSEMERIEKEDISSDIRQDYTQSGSPYNELATTRQDTRWAESQVLPSRRSTSSSITSASSTEEHVSIPPYKNQIAPIPFPPCTLDAGPYHSYSESSSYQGPVSLFPPQSCTAPIPYPSPGAAMFPPPFGAPFPTPQSLLTHVPKPIDDSLNMQSSPCTAAFTSSSHNMALTAAMVSPTKMPTPPPQPLPQHQPPQPVLPPAQPTSEPEQQIGSPALPLSFVNTVPETSGPENTPTQETLLDNKSTPLGKKSPSKPTRTSARVTSLQGKSPGKSPRQEVPKAVLTARGRGRATKTSQSASIRNRGRGRGRGRGRNNQNSALTSHINVHNDDSIQSKLYGTVYDFDSDEDSTSEANIADLRTMRERKKSTDVNEKRDNFGLVNDGMQNLTSPMHKKYNEDKRISSPVHDNSTVSEAENNSGKAFADTVLPLLPGPVDMRTYNSTIDTPSSSHHSQSYTNHLLGSFANVSADQSLPDIEEDIEKELHSALIASNEQPGATKPNFSSPIMDASTSNLNDANKVSLTDSRNQLKVKIKGPFLDANYVPASAVPPLAQQAPVIIPPTATSASVASGTSNLRRMRKKELLRQYCSQDMNMDDPVNVAQAPIIMPPINRTVITIPKAVASMTSIPTREDYKAVVDANMEKKRRKERGGSFVDVQEDDGNSDRRRSIMPGNVDRRRGRQAKTTTATVTNSSGPPKLKIKIGNSIIGQEGNVQDDRSRIRPPKKRLSCLPHTPSMEELRRESMKFRRMIMAGFDDDEKPKVKSKKDKNGKRRKRGSKKEGQVQILEGGAATPKLIIRLGKSNNSSNDLANNTEEDKSLENAQELDYDNRVGPPPPEMSNEQQQQNFPQDGSGLDNAQQQQQQQPANPNAGAAALRNIRSEKVTPIRLKLTRCQEGYELKDPVASSVDNGSCSSAIANSVAPSEDSSVKVDDSSDKRGSNEDNLSLLAQSTAHNSPGCPPAPLPQGCQVR